MKFVLLFLSVPFGVILDSSAALLPEKTAITGTPSTTEELGKAPEQQNSGPIIFGICRGKAFAYGVTKMSWFDSVTFCYQHGYIPASLDDSQDFDFVIEHSKNLVNGKKFWFWTAATDFGSPRIFTWFHDRIPVGLPAILNSPTQRCLALDFVPGGKSILNDYGCSSKGGLPLCHKRSS